MLTGIDYAMIFGWVVFIVIMTFFTGRLSTSVGDYLSSNRCAGRYLLCTATDMGTFAVIYMIAVFQQYYQSGFAGEWWNWLVSMPLMMILPMTGWVQYRYRESRAQTMPELFEMRYGRKFRIFTGLLAFIAGILNYGIFPAVTARAMIAICGLPDAFLLCGFEISTYPVMMIALLAIALRILLSGGHVSVMITDFLQGSMVFIGFSAIFIYMLMRFGLDGIVDPLVNAAPGTSRINPFDQSSVSDFNIWFFVLLAFNRLYSWLVWPSAQGYMAAAKSPHDAKMARVLGQWAGLMKQGILIAMPLLAFVIINNPGLYSAESSGALNALSQVTDPNLKKELTVPLALLHTLPPGILGLLVMVMIGAAVTTDNSFIHSWSSIFVQDVVVPITGKRLPPVKHLRMLKLSVFGVAVFAFIWSMIFPLKEWIFMYFQITSSLFLSGAGIALIGALYWKKGTVQGAWGAVVTGLIISVTGIILRQCWEQIPGALNMAPEFPINGVYVFTISAICSSAVYILVSLLTCRQDFNLDKLLHRGVYAVKDSMSQSVTKKKTWRDIIGITSEFTRLDKMIYLGCYLWIIGFLLLNLVCTAWNFWVHPLSNGFWAGLWKTYLIILGIIEVIATIWFTTGGFIDLKQLVKTLRGRRADESDDGFVGS
jgi:SSS family solute:Na+ symporter